jgi:hypothetical protein
MIISSQALSLIIYVSTAIVAIAVIALLALWLKDSAGGKLW